MRYCIIGRSTGEPLTYRGWVLVHPDKSELQFLFPGERIGVLPNYYDDSLTMQLKDHPDMEVVEFPLEQNMHQFRK